MGLYFPGPHPKYVHPNGTTHQFFHLWENQHFEQNFFKVPHVPKGCTYWSNILGRENPLPKESFHVFFGSQNFSKFLQPISKGIWAQKAFLGLIFAES